MPYMLHVVYVEGISMRTGSRQYTEGCSHAMNQTSKAQGYKAAHHAHAAI